MYPRGNPSRAGKRFQYGVPNGFASTIIPTAATFARLAYGQAALRAAAFNRRAMRSAVPLITDYFGPAGDPPIDLTAEDYADYVPPGNSTYPRMRRMSDSGYASVGLTQGSLRRALYAHTFRSRSYRKERRRVLRDRSRFYGRRRR